MYTEGTSHNRSSTALRGNFVMLRADSLHLLLPQHEVESAGLLEHELQPTATPGVFEYGAAVESRRVLAPSAQLRPLEVFPNDRFVLTRLAGHAMYFAWNEVKVLIDTALEIHPLPTVMQRRDGVIAGYVSLGEVLAYRADADRVVSFMCATGA